MVSKETLLPSQNMLFKMGIKIGHEKILFVAFCWAVTSTGPGWFIVYVYFMMGASEGSTHSGSGEAVDRTLRPLVYNPIIIRSKCMKRSYSLNLMCPKFISN